VGVFTLTKNILLRDCHNALNEQGVLVLNIWREALHSSEALEEILAHEFNTRLLSFEVESGNTIVLAFKNAIPSMKRKELPGRVNCYARLLWSRQQQKFRPG